MKNSIIEELEQNKAEFYKTANEIKVKNEDDDDMREKINLLLDLYDGIFDTIDKENFLVGIDGIEKALLKIE